MTADQSRLAPAERRAVLYGSLYRILGTPVVVAVGFLNTSIIVRETGEQVFGLVSLVATMSLLFPFADLGIGATVLSASSQLAGNDRNPRAANIIRRAYHVLSAVAGVLIVVALCIMVLDGWSVLIGLSSGPDDRWAITLAACLFAVTIPAGLGYFILIGIGRNPLATLLMMSSPVFALTLTLLLRTVDANGIWYAVAAPGGAVITQMLSTVLGLRLSGLGWSGLGSASGSRSDPRPLTGSLWLFLVSLGAPVGLQTGRILLAHLSTPAELSRYALMAQMYAMCWQVLSTAGLAYWPVFVKRRGAHEVTVRMWWRLIGAFVALAAIAALGIAALGPWAATVLSGGQIAVSTSLALAIGVLLVCQAAHYPSNMLLTRPTEARWLAFCTLSMAAISIGLGYFAAIRFGAVGVAYASALAILVAQVVPDLLWAPRLVRRRPAFAD
jgi:O-antigen/teichoic acid export membrane protein